MRWEYTFYAPPTGAKVRESIEALNTLGDQGWELVNFEMVGGQKRYYLKRMKPIITDGYEVD